MYLQIAINNNTVVIIIILDQLFNVCKLLYSILFAELSGNYNDVRKQFTDTLNFAEPHSKNRLIVFQNTNAREKRETVNAPIPDQTSSEETAEGPVVYNTTEAIIYSSKPLLLRINSTTISLGRAYLVTANTGKRAMYKIIKANIKTEDGKLFLSFLFPYTDSYWWLTSIEIELPDGSKYNVTTKREIMAPKRFSYHCGGETTFADTVNAVELRFFELQVQMNVTKGRFDDAYDCVPFTTGPIWSGLFVTFILAVGLVVALGAIGSIKTMDKFDNHKTKQLSITVFE